MVSTEPKPTDHCLKDSQIGAAAALKWLVEAGADVVTAAAPVDRLAALLEPGLQQPARSVAPLAQDSEHAIRQPATAKQAPLEQAKKHEVPAPRAASSRLEEVARATSLAQNAATLEELRAALEAFDGCGLKDTATNLVFSDGPVDAPLMLIGEAPGRDEDLQGKPFVGASGQLLTRILAAARLPRESVYITNIMPWRPPGNRKPTPLETQIMLPFIRRHIKLKNPQAILLLGGTPASALTGKTEGITRLRGRWQSLNVSPDGHDGLAQTSGAAGHEGVIYKALPTFHPAYLLRQPTHKAYIWADMLMMKSELSAA